MTNFLSPHSVMFVKERPKTATGKIQKYILRAQQPAIAPQWMCQDQLHRHNECAWQLTLLRDRATKNFRRQIGTRDQ